MVFHWTAHSAMALRAALNLTLADFADLLGLSRSTVSHWSAPGSSASPGLEAQELLSVALERASSQVQTRFWSTVAVGTGSPVDTIDGSDIGAQIQDAAAQSMTMADDAMRLASSAEQLTYLRDELCRIAVAYVHTPLADVVADLREAQKTLSAIARTHHRPGDAQEITVLSGVLCLLLAHASQNSGDPKSALRQLRAASTFATVADSDALRAWGLGTAALMLEWSSRPDEAARRAQKGLHHAASAESHRRLLAITARSAARAGDAPTAREALARLDDLNPAAGDDEVVRFGGLLRFPETKLTYYRGGALTLLGDYDHAETCALRAIADYETGAPEDRSYGDEALARLDVTLARLGQDNVTGALAAAEPVLALDRQLRIEQIDNAVRRVHAGTRALTRRGHPDAAQLDDRLAGYLATAGPAPRALPSAGA
ncbi:helix-turn-helix domain-containing protein [Amycolatopsis orientalis]|uniref:helix-turn-helix domain-containing protein n=1 Tax=Amycolatopsis orientalis TaxID=31958 RepID=UPI000412B019|nr:helix-turn-helix transcriptional regulator [Amycolatopsis orientalis]